MATARLAGSSVSTLGKHLHNADERVEAFSVTNMDSPVLLFVLSLRAVALGTHRRLLSRQATGVARQTARVSESVCIGRFHARAEMGHSHNKAARVR
jgi:hypothetical protein